MVKLSELLIQTDAPLVVSGCLAGLKCRYDGQSKPVEAVRRLVEEGRAITICPEVLGGLPTPRPASGIRKRQALSDMSEQMSDKVSEGRTERGLERSLRQVSAQEPDRVPAQEPSQVSRQVFAQEPSQVSCLVSEAGADRVTDSVTDAIAGAAVWQDQAELVNREGRLVTDNYRRGAQLALQKARALGSQVAILKQHSPSCGVGSTGGADPWQRLKGDGVTTALFKCAGLTVVSDEDIEWDL